MPTLCLARLVCLTEWPRLLKECDRWTEIWQDEERMERKDYACAGEDDRRDIFVAIARVPASRDL